MNKLIKNLKEKSYIREIEYDMYNGASYYVSAFSEEKFAELIVEECVKYLRTTDFSEVVGSQNDVSETAATNLLNLFGIEQ